MERKSVLGDDEDNGDGSHKVEAKVAGMVAVAHSLRQSRSVDKSGMVMKVSEHSLIICERLAELLSHDGSKLGRAQNGHFRAVAEQLGDKVI